VSGRSRWSGAADRRVVDVPQDSRSLLGHEGITAQSPPPRPARRSPPDPPGQGRAPGSGACAGMRAVRRMTDARGGDRWSHATQAVTLSAMRLARVRTAAPWALVLAIWVQAALGPAAPHALVLCLGCTSTGINVGAGCLDAGLTAHGQSCCCEDQGRSPEEHGLAVDRGDCGCVDVSLETSDQVLVSQRPALSGESASHPSVAIPAVLCRPEFLGKQPPPGLRGWPPGPPRIRSACSLLALGTCLRV
jgi:hypothetical protein